jgi:hypothetical protein
MSYEVDTRQKASNGKAFLELFGLGAIALFAMGALAIGYNTREPSQTAQSTPPAATAASASDRMTNPPQARANPADKPQVPTSSTSPGPGGDTVGNAPKQ